MTSIIISVSLFMFCCYLTIETVSILDNKISKLSAPSQVIACYSIGGFYGFIFWITIFWWVL